MENAAINILKRSIDNLKSQAIQIDEKLQLTLKDKENYENEIEYIFNKIREIENAVTQLEGKNEQTSTKNKKTK